MTEWLRKQAARPVSSEFCERDSAGDADFNDLKAWARWAYAGRHSARAEYHREALDAARRLDARSVLAGQLSAEEFRDVWEACPYEIVAGLANPDGAPALYGGEIASESAGAHNQTGTSVPTTPRSIRVDKEGVGGSAQHSRTAAGRSD